MLKRKTMKKWDLELSKDRIARLAELMNAGVDPASPEEELALDRSLNEQLQKLCPPEAKGIDADPLCVNDAELWRRLEQKGGLGPARRGSQRFSSAWALGAAAAAVLAGLMVWTFRLHKEKNLKGSGAGEWTAAPCELALQGTGERFAIEDLASRQIQPGEKLLVYAKCREAGFLHLRIVAGQQSVVFFNARVTGDNYWQLLKQSSEDGALGFLVPAGDSLKLSYGLSRTQLGEDATWPDKWPGAPWVWLRDLELFHREK